MADEDSIFVRVRGLTQELFDIIHEFVLIPNPPRGRMIEVDKSYKPPSFLRFTRHSRRSAAATYYSTNTFSFTDLQYCWKWLESLKPEHTKQLRTLRHYPAKGPTSRRLRLSGPEAERAIKAALLSAHDKLSVGLKVWQPDDSHSATDEWFVFELISDPTGNIPPPTLSGPLSFSGPSTLGGPPYSSGPPTLAAQPASSGPPTSDGLPHLSGIFAGLSLFNGLFTLGGHHNLGAPQIFGGPPLPSATPRTRGPTKSWKQSWNFPSEHMRS